MERDKDDFSHEGSDSQANARIEWKALAAMADRECGSLWIGHLGEKIKGYFGNGIR